MVIVIQNIPTTSYLNKLIKTIGIHHQIDMCKLNDFFPNDTNYLCVIN